METPECGHTQHETAKGVQTPRLVALVILCLSACCAQGADSKEKWATKDELVLSFSQRIGALCSSVLVPALGGDPASCEPASRRYLAECVASLGDKIPQRFSMDEGVDAHGRMLVDCIMEKYKQGLANPVAK